MTSHSAWLGVVFLLAAGPISAFADEQPVAGANSKITLSGVGWARYYYNLEDAPKDNQLRDLNSFDVDRVYVTGAYQIDEKYKWTTTLEARNRAGALDIFLKKAYLSVKEPLHLDHTNLSFGQMDHVMVPYEEKVWGHRAVSQVPIDSYFGISSALVGVGMDGMVADGKLDWAASISNARPYDKEIKVKYKTAAARATLAPFSSERGQHAKLAAFAQFDNDEAPTADNFNFSWTVLPYYKTDRFTAAFEYSSRADRKHGTGAGRVEGTQHEEDRITVTSTVLSAFVTGMVSERVGLYGRLDIYDPDGDTDDDGSTRIIGGVSHRCAKGLRGLFDVDYTQYEEPSGVDLDAQITLSARAEASF